MAVKTNKIFRKRSNRKRSNRKRSNRKRSTNKRSNNKRSKRTRRKKRVQKLKRTTGWSPNIQLGGMEGDDDLFGNSQLTLEPPIIRTGRPEAMLILTLPEKMTHPEVINEAVTHLAEKLQLKDTNFSVYLEGKILTVSILSENASEKMVELSTYLQNPENDLFPQQALDITYETTDIPSGDLTLGRKIGAGGFGAVYEGTYKFPGLLVDPRPVAVKVYKNAPSYETGIASYNKTKNIHCEPSPSILPEGGKFNGYIHSGHWKDSNDTICQVLIMELYPGIDLFDLICGILESKREKLSDVELFRIAKDLLLQLESLHGNDPPLAHRDIKCENVMVDVTDLASLDREENPVIARLIDFDWTQEAIAQFDKGDQKGTVYYCAPELVQFDKTEIDLRPADMFAFGVLLYLMTNYKYPWKRNEHGIGAKDNLKSIKGKQIKNVHHFKLSPETPEVFAQIIQNLLIAEPTDRWTATQTLEALEEEDLERQRLEQITKDAEKIEEDRLEQMVEDQEEYGAQGD